MNNTITTIWSNPHLRYSVVILMLLEVAGIWFPAYKAQLDSTSKVVQFYAIAAAANSGGAPAQTNLAQSQNQTATPVGGLQSPGSQPKP